MKMPVLEPTSAAKSGWLIILLTVGWMGFVLWPWPKDKPAATPRAIPMPATSLTRAGLAEYTDWQGLPEIFAIWADKAEWKDGRTLFAYWHPVMKTYSYYFEAVRVGREFHFKEIAEPSTTVGGYYWDESLGEDCPIRFYRSPPDEKWRTSGPPPTPADPTLNTEKPGDVRVKIPIKETKTILVNPVPKP